MPYLNYAFQFVHRRQLTERSSPLQFSPVLCTSRLCTVLRGIAANHAAVRRPGFGLMKFWHGSGQWYYGLNEPEEWDTSQAPLRLCASC